MVKSIPNKVFFFSSLPIASGNLQDLIRCHTDLISGKSGVNVEHNLPIEKNTA
jgi:hypothetical protein